MSNGTRPRQRKEHDAIDDWDFSCIASHDTPAHPSVRDRPAVVQMPFAEDRRALLSLLKIGVR
jgi:hypothetical protein